MLSKLIDESLTWNVKKPTFILNDSLNDGTEWYLKRIVCSFSNIDEQLICFFFDLDVSEILIFNN